MKKIEVCAEARSKADPASVFALLKDGATWPRWSVFDGFELERHGRPDPLGVGAIRVFTTKISRAREEVVELVPDRRLGYVLLSGFPMRDYRADVDLEPLPGGGTLIRWQSSFHPKHIGAGWFWRFFVRKVIGDVATQLAKAAEDPAMVAACAEPPTRNSRAQ